MTIRHRGVVDHQAEYYKVSGYSSMANFLNIMASKSGSENIIEPFNWRDDEEDNSDVYAYWADAFEQKEDKVVRSIREYEFDQDSVLYVLEVEDYEEEVFDLVLLGDEERRKYAFEMIEKLESTN